MALGILAASLWLGLRFRRAAINSPQPGACKEWEKAEVINQGLGWDLNYNSLVRRAGLCPGLPVCELIAQRPLAPVEKYSAVLQGEPIISSVLYELPDGHAGFRATWMVRTKDHAYVLHPGESVPVDKQPIPGSDYDRVFEEMACWRQDEPPNRTFGEKGYMGFLSLFKEGKSRQMLLTHNDLFEGNTYPEEEDKPGRFFRALEPLRSYWLSRSGLAAIQQFLCS
ncbi:MAG TPA: hypothetical protein VGW76_18470 [Pyrinomonadaceae bacterium]|nr:hypothetical protein [Pyrinomonadaceae bacterium]